MPSKAVSSRAIFWDRDGTLIEDRGYLHDPSDVVLYPGTITALRKLQEDFLFFMVTNQVGVAKGLITAAQLQTVNEHLLSLLKQEGISFTGVYVCPHRKEDNCVCRKPEPYFVKIAASEHQLDLSRSFVVGDHPSDLELARRSGAKGIYVCTGHGANHLNELPAGEIALKDIGAVAAWILAQP